MTQSDIYVKIKEIESLIESSKGDRHSLIKKNNNYWYLLGQLDAYKSLIE